MKTEKFTCPNKVITGLGTGVHREDWITDDGVLKWLIEIKVVLFTMNNREVMFIINGFTIFKAIWNSNVECMTCFWNNLH